MADSLKQMPNSENSKEDGIAFPVEEGTEPLSLGQNGDDYEDTTYEESNLDPRMDGESDLDPTYLRDDNHIHNILVHQYDRELLRMSGLKNQSIFIFTAIGFLLTILVGIIGSNWFSLSYLERIPWVFYVILVVCLAVTIYYALSVYYKIENDKEYWWEYPGNELLDICKSSSPEILVNMRSVCRTLAIIIDHNAKNNNESQILLNKSHFSLIATIIYFILLMIGLFVVSYTSYPEYLIINADVVNLTTNTSISSHVL